MKRIDPTPRYSKAVVHGGTVYLAGLIAENWDGDVSAQANEIFAQIDQLLAKAGTDRSRVLSMTCWLKDFADYAAFNAAYDAWIDPRNLPARATVRADLLDPRLRIEIMTIASMP
jgi:enamine deaminase RidA (YjgF/YER057c/UK114 family)